MEKFRGEAAVALSDVCEEIFFFPFTVFEFGLNSESRVDFFFDVDTDFEYCWTVGEEPGDNDVA